VSPYTIQEWFDSFYEFVEEEPAAVEGICGAGELIFVPTGWWHLAVNLEETLAVTQNYVSPRNLEKVLNHLATPHLISGCPVVTRPNLRALFVDALRGSVPQIMGSFDAAAAEKAKVASGQTLSSLFSAPAGRTPALGPKRKLDQISSASDDTSFSFGFAL